MCASGSLCFQYIILRITLKSKKEEIDFHGETRIKQHAFRGNINLTKVVCLVSKRLGNVNIRRWKEDNTENKLDWISGFYFSVLILEKILFSPNPWTKATLKFTLSLTMEKW